MGGGHGYESVMCDDRCRRRLPLSVLVTGANTNDSLVFEALLDDIPLVQTSAGRRRCRPEKVHADKA